MAETLLKKRFGPLSVEWQARLADWSESRLSDLVAQAYRVDSVDQFASPPRKLRDG